LLTHLIAAVFHAQTGFTPLHWAAQSSSSVAVVHALLAAYPEAATARDNYGETPAGRAKYNDNTAVKAFFASGQHFQATPGQSVAAAADAQQEAEDAQLAAAIAASLAVSGPATPPPPFTPTPPSPFTPTPPRSLAASRFMGSYNQPERKPDQLYALIATDFH
jgi:hypothetical protein